MRKPNTSILSFDALSLEGGLFNAEWLAKVAHLEAQHQKPEDYEIPVGLNIRDEIARAWRIAQALWLKFEPRGNGANRGAYAATEKFAVALLEQAFGFARLVPQASPLAVADRVFPISYVWEHVPIVVSAHSASLDEGQTRFGEANRRRSAFGLLQEYLNSATGHLWGIVTNGLSLRLVRDNASLTRPAWLEADLSRIFSEERFADFSTLWLMIHASRLGRPDGAASECVLEIWRALGQQSGIRAREELRKGVERALQELGQGFLSERTNARLRAALMDGSASAHEFFQQLLRLVYRLIFLLTVEERGLLHPPDSSADAEQLYLRGYSLRRLRERAVRHSAHDDHIDLYEGVKTAFRCLASGESRLALPALGGLYAEDQTPLLDAARLQNRHLLGAVWALAWIARQDVTERVNWRDMGPEELGSVYESLLELVPKINDGATSFRFAHIDDSRGNARKLSGSYYTPDLLVQALLDSALEPVVAQKRRERPENEAASILSIAVIDPAVGSGHFLIAAARRLAGHVARARAQGQPSAAEHRRAVRDVVSHCLFGVDRNPMALELAKMALWLEAMTPEAPLSFLDAHLVLGDALLGVLEPAMLTRGIPDDAYKALDNDDKEVCARLRKRNAASRKTLSTLLTAGQSTLSFATDSAAAALARIDALPDDTLQGIAEKRAAYIALHEEQQRSSLAEDLFVAAYLLPKHPASERIIPTTEHLLCALTNQPIDSAVTEMAVTVSRRHGALHWRDAFAHVFARGGFDCVLGNPPWETMSPDAKEFFSAYDPQVRFMSPDEQRIAFTSLLERPAVAKQWDEYCNELYRYAEFFKTSGRYRLFAPGNLGKGDLNVYRMFVETALAITCDGGYAAQLVPEGFYKGANAAAIRRAVFEYFNLKLLFAFVNTRAVWFPSIHQQFEFCMYVAEKSGCTTDFLAAFRVSTPAKLSQILMGDALRIPVSMVAEFSSEAMAVMEFAAQEEINICRKMYERFPRFGDHLHELPYRSYMAEIHMGSDRHLFSDTPDGLPVFEGRMIDLYDYRAKGYASGRGRAAEWIDQPFGSVAKRICPQWRIPRDAIPNKVRERMTQYRIGFCDVVNPVTEKCLVTAVIPPDAVCGHSVPTMLFDSGGISDLLLWIGIANSLTMDFVVRKKVRLHMSYTVLDSLPFPRDYSSTRSAEEIALRVCALCAVGAEMASFRDACVESFATSVTPVEDPEERARVAAEINVLVARDVYGLSDTDMRFILDPQNVLGSDCGLETFAVLRKRETKQYGEYRTQRLVMDAWERLASLPLSGSGERARRSLPNAPYVSSAVPNCEPEDWLAGLVCDVVAYAGPLTEADLRLVLSTRPSALSSNIDLLQWTSAERLDRLPQVLRWLRKLLLMPSNGSIELSRTADLSGVLGDTRTRRYAEALVQAHRSQQAAADVARADGNTAPLASVQKRA